MINWERAIPGLADITQPFDLLAERIAKTAAGAAGKEPDQLTDLERTAIGLMAGCEWELTETGVRCKNPCGIQKIDGKFIVGERRGLAAYPPIDVNAKSLYAYTGPLPDSDEYKAEAEEFSEMCSRLNADVSK